MNAKATAMGKKRAPSNSSSSSSDSFSASFQSTTKSALRTERGELLLVIQATQDIEEENEQLGLLVDGWAAEVDELRRALAA